MVASPKEASFYAPSAYFIEEGSRLKCTTRSGRQYPEDTGRTRIIPRQSLRRSSKIMLLLTSGCSGSMTGYSRNKADEIDFKEIKGGRKFRVIQPPGFLYETMFWATAKAKTINGEVQIQALVDGKKVIVTETSMRRALQLKDVEGTESLPNATIFAELERLGTIASAIICLATNQKFNFSKYIFDNMVKNLEGGVKFLTYPRFVQVFLNKQVEGMTKHKEIYVTPSHTKKVFANMKKEGKGFSERVTPLFETIMVQAQEEGEGSEMPIVPQHTSTINQASSSQPPKKQKPRKTKKPNTEVSQSSDPTQPMVD
ncbi:hypothetical protein Tco_1303015 [Tanacetum coccineum]